MKFKGRYLPLLFLLLLAPSTSAQEKRTQSNKTQSKPTVAAKTPTFDTLIGNDCYKIYGEVRNVGQVIKSESANQLLEPVMKLAGPPQEFKSIIRFINLHSEEVMTSRLLLATWPTAKGVPDVIVAIDFSSAEEATKFSTPLNTFLKKVLPPTEEPPVGDAENSPAKLATKNLKPKFFLTQYGSMLVLTSTKLSIPALKQSGRLLADNPNFRQAHSRFSSEAIFLFVDLSAIEREEEERRKQYEAEAKRRQEELEEELAKKAQTTPAEEKNEEAQTDPPAPVVVQAEITGTPTSTANEEPTTPPVSIAMQAVGSSFFGGQSKWPDAIGLAISLEGDSFDARALLINSSGDKSDAFPFLPMLIPGPAIVSESPSVLPADTELFISFSLDFPQIYARMTTPPAQVPNAGGPMQNVSEVNTPLGTFEKQLKINIKDELLPLLGPEIAISLPLHSFDGFAFAMPRFFTEPPVQTGSTSQAQNSQSESNSKQPFIPGPIISISVRDREGMKALMPKIIESLGFKGAGAFAQTETKEDTEIVSFANSFAYAFVGNFLVLSSDSATIRHVVESYLKHETLASDNQFKNYTRWQPRQLQGQLYVSPALMEGYKKGAQQPNTMISDQTREYFSRLSVIAQPITYSLSNDGLGAFHELHVPKNLVIMGVAAIAGESNPSPLLNNERSAIGALYSIYSAEIAFRDDKGAGNYTTLEDLLDQQLVNKEMIENHGYRFEVVANGAKFQVTATPLEYGKSGRRSFFIDESGVVRAGDHGGGNASASDDPQ